jgi:hypothetical protein
MCLLIARLKGDWLPSEREFSNAWKRNSDGFGIAWAQKGKLHTHKTLSYQDALGLVRTIPKGAPALLHWRLGTHGSVSLDNCHPFPLPKSSGWIGAHNGVLSIPAHGNLTDSETYFRTLKGAPRIDIVERFLKTQSGGKMAFLHESGEIRIANESHPDASWEVKGEVWVSNNSLEGFPSYFGAFRGAGARFWEPEHKEEERDGLTPILCDYCGREGVDYRTRNSLSLCWSCAEDWAEF